MSNPICECGHTASSHNTGNGDCPCGCQHLVIDYHGEEREALEVENR